MRQLKLLGVTLATALLLAACGGGGGDGDQTPAIKFTSLVSFGDSLSDVGTYSVGDIARVGGGKWTVNSPSAKNWTELIAAQYGLPAPCAAETGLPNVLAITTFTMGDVTIADYSNCTNYAQGSARVTSPVGPYSEAFWQTVYGAVLQGAATQNGLTLAQAAAVPTITAAAAATANSEAPQRYMALPVASQMAKVPSYSGSELVTIDAGANDVFLQLGAVSVAAAGGGNAVIGAVLAGWDKRADWASLQATLYAGSTGADAAAKTASALAAAQAAQTAAVQGMAQAANEMAALIKAQVAKGARHIVMINVPDVSITPFANAAETGAPGTKALVTALVTTFNSTLQTALAGSKEVVVVDAFADSHNQSIHPASYALSNVTTPVCDTTSVNNPLNTATTPLTTRGSSIACTAASSIAGDTSAYMFADSVHPTPYGYKLLAQLATRSLVLAGWL